MTIREARKKSRRDERRFVISHKMLPQQIAQAIDRAGAR